MNLRNWAFAAAAAALLCGCGADTAAAGANPPQVSTASLAIVPLEIRSKQRAHSFEVEVARTPEQQARGLMFRRSLGPDQGMIFPFAAPQPASFWMKNTLIPLDIIFIRADGTIARIAAQTVPLSLDPVSVGEPVSAVLEIAGGRAAALGLSEGDVVTWPRTP